MKYRWYYIEVFRDAKERFEKQKTAGAEIPQQSLLEGAFEYLDQRHSLGEEEQYDFYKNDGIFSGLVNLFNNSEEVRENTNASIKYIRKQANTLHLTLSNNMKYEV